MADIATITRWLPAALWITAMLIVLRLIWAFAQAYIPRAINREEGRRDPVSWRWITVIGWSGLRGIVSLAAALALPLHDDAGHYFPRRAAIIFIAFGLIVITLVGQGLSLIPILRWLKLETGEDTAAYEIKVRVKALNAGLKKLETLAEGSENDMQRATLSRAVAEYQSRIDHLQHHIDRAAFDAAGETPESRFDHDIQEQSIAAERREIMHLRDEGKIPDEIFRKVQYDLDLAQSRLI
jgi:monovalent cation/hydrogen antiporter